MNIRAFNKGDIDSCLDIYNYYIEHTCFSLEEDKLGHEEFESRCDGIAKKYPFIVLENDGVIEGYAHLNTFNPRSAYRKTADLSIYVNKSHLREHIGAILLQEIEKRAKESGITNIISIFTSENENSLRFHLKNGFVLEGTIHDATMKFGKVIGVHYLRKILV